MSPGEEGETPKEEKAQEGHGSQFWSKPPTVRTDARGEQGLEVGPVFHGAASTKMPLLVKDHHLDGSKDQRDDAATRRRTNHKRATAFERTCGSAGGMNPGGCEPQGRDRHETRPAGSGRIKALRA